MIPTHQTIAAFIRQWVRDMLDQHGITFNELLDQGYCADLATVIWEHFGRNLAIRFHETDAPCHTWLEFDGRHYDMQNPDGVKDWHQMDYFSG